MKKIIPGVLALLATLLVPATSVSAASPEFETFTDTISFEVSAEDSPCGIDFVVDEEVKVRIKTSVDRDGNELIQTHANGVTTVTSSKGSLCLLYTSPSPRDA